MFQIVNLVIPSLVNHQWFNALTNLPNVQNEIFQHQISSQKSTSINPPNHNSTNQPLPTPQNNHTNLHNSHLKKKPTTLSPSRKPSHPRPHRTQKTLAAFPSRTRKARGARLSRVIIFIDNNRAENIIGAGHRDSPSPRGLHMVRSASSSSSAGYCFVGPLCSG